jgi:hypothetical protein
MLFRAVTAQESRNFKEATMQFRAITPEQARAAAAAAQPPVAAAAAAPPVAPEVAAVSAPPTTDPADLHAPPPDLTNTPTDYPGDGATKKQLAKWLAKQAEKAGLPAELPVMAALVESGVKNLNYGHADSVGFFQMRVGIWNQGPYAGYARRPELQMKWFIDQASAVKRREIAAGNTNFGKDPAKWGEWIADIERPAEQYRGRYQLRLREARALLK